ncbi:hypothetical protein Trydic_g4470 [Trypoxylus dichotomus]
MRDSLYIDVILAVHSQNRKILTFICGRKRKSLFTPCVTTRPNESSHRLIFLLPRVYLQQYRYECGGQPAANMNGKAIPETIFHHTGIVRQKSRDIYALVKRARLQPLALNVYVRLSKFEKGKHTFNRASSNKADKYLHTRTMDSTMAFIIIGFILCGNCMYLSNARRVHFCTPCMSLEECNQEPNEVCVWGESRDKCGRRECAKGPGERCGGPMSVYGNCGEGLMCKSDERCHGCIELRDSNFVCYPNNDF